MIWCTYTFKCVVFFVSVTCQYLFCTDMTISAVWYPNFPQWTFSSSNMWLIKETLIFSRQNRNFCNKELAPLSDLSQNHALPDTVPPTFPDSSAQFYIITELIMWLYFKEKIGIHLHWQDVARLLAKNVIWTLLGVSILHHNLWISQLQ